MLSAGIEPDPRRSILGILARVDPVSAIGVLSKIIGLGIKGWSALGDRDLSKDDLEALRTLLDTSASILATRQPQAARPISPGPISARPIFA